MAKERVHIIVYGRVQGVFFRAMTVETAVNMKITGWVMNRSDGTVEIVAEGGRKKLEKLVRWCRNGPTNAQVTDLEISWEAYSGDFFGFKIRY
jgi:acylphosphatase